MVSLETMNRGVIFCLFRRSRIKGSARSMWVLFASAIPFFAKTHIEIHIFFPEGRVVGTVVIKLFIIR